MYTSFGADGSFKSDMSGSEGLHAPPPPPARGFGCGNMTVLTFPPAPAYGVLGKVPRHRATAWPGHGRLAEVAPTVTPEAQETIAAPPEGCLIELLFANSYVPQPKHQVWPAPTFHHMRTWYLLRRAATAIRVFLLKEAYDGCDGRR